ncbi:MAG: TyrR/PhhR family helix-turn-helix DNA-binding protein [Paraclostridium sp.]
MYDYPGNIRQLENIIQNILVTSTSNNITIENLPSYLQKGIDLPNNTYSTSFDKLIENYEKHIIINAYKKYPSSYKVATALNISQTKSSRLIRKYINQK